MKIIHYKYWPIKYQHIREVNYNESDHIKFSNKMVKIFVLTNNDDTINIDKKILGILLPYQHNKKLTINKFYKIVNTHINIESETKNLVPYLYDAFVIEDKKSTIGIMVMDLKKYTLYEVIVNKIMTNDNLMIELYNLCETASKIGISCKDININNIMSDGKSFYLINISEPIYSNNSNANVNYNSILTELVYFTNNKRRPVAKL
jgi:hypothetical protein